ncbi:TSHSV-HP5 [Trionyx sinensis hemorrhagic syndrome virus]|uniref:TSHSV-HP5 n=1 Tax=Trionyx sinensis hemorrhagic syndrome virus TaxID=1705352 RepID=A0AAE7M388_9NIDO|nr:TSHSV-HP5 [Trionyx sinensis hemorrhagic syndrome virus]QNI38736.1 TSHSV-HP5 [Trionyx sinensis hemorrhagic syndrome virus]
MNFLQALAQANNRRDQRQRRPRNQQPQQSGIIAYNPDNQQSNLRRQRSNSVQDFSSMFQLPKPRPRKPRNDFSQLLQALTLSQGPKPTKKSQPVVYTFGSGMGPNDCRRKPGCIGSSKSKLDLIVNQAARLLREGGGAIEEVGGNITISAEIPNPFHPKELTPKDSSS